MSIHTEILKDIEFAASFSPCHNLTSIATQTSLLKFKSTVKKKKKKGCVCPEILAD